MWEIRLRTANFDDFKMLHLQATCETQNQRQEVYCAYLDHTRLFPFRGCARSKPQFLTAVPSLKLYRLTQVDVWMTRKLFNFGSVCWERYSVSQPRETLSVTIAKGSSHSHSDICVLESIDHVPPNIPNSSHSTQLYKNSKSIRHNDPDDQQRTKPKPEARHKNAQSRFGLFF